MTDKPNTNALWQKGGSAMDPVLMAFLAGEDVLLDRALLPFDIEASAAHARGLARIGLLSEAECASLCTELDALANAFADGTFVLDARFEDGHAAIEWWLTERLGELGKRIHTARSRNDQVLVALRLYERAAIDRLMVSVRSIIEHMLARADAEMLRPMPGYTHLQRAMVTSTGQWWAAYAESLIDSLQVLRDARALINANPLGTGAGFGVNLPLPRDAVAAELGFARLLLNPIAAQLSRGKYEWQVLAALAQVLGDVRRFAFDLSLFATAEFDFVRMPDTFTTGSSLMPQKRNPDVVELLRTAPAPVLAAMSELSGIQSLPSGYHRDQQAGKGPVLRGLQHTGIVLHVFGLLIDAVDWNDVALCAAIDPSLYATDLAIELTRSGVPFRDAYREAAKTWPERCAGRTPEASLEARVSPGASGSPALDRLHERLVSLFLS